MAAFGLWRRLRRRRAERAAAAQGPPPGAQGPAAPPPTGAPVAPAGAPPPAAAAPPGARPRAAARPAAAAPARGASAAAGAGALGAGALAGLGRLLVWLINIALVALVIIIGAGILFVVLKANSKNTIVSDIHDAAKTLVGPFDGLFKPKNHNAAVAINWGIALIVYLIAGRVLGRLIAPLAARAP